MATHVCYHVPSDRDDPDHPNVFTLSKPAEEILLKDIKTSFPLPGHYHFRFKVKIDNAFYWLDVTDDNIVVPAHSSRKIVAKVLRLSWKCEPEKPLQEPPLQKPQQQPQSFDIFGNSSPKRAQQSQPISNGNSSVCDLDLFS